jgi:hypothetical protein
MAFFHTIKLRIHDLEAFKDGGWYVQSIKDKCKNQPSYYKFMDESIVFEPLFDFIDFFKGHVVRP